MRSMSDGRDFHSRINLIAIYYNALIYYCQVCEMPIYIAIMYNVFQMQHKMKAPRNVSCMTWSFNTFI